MFLYKVIHRVIHRLFIGHNLFCKVIMKIDVKTLCKLALQVKIKSNKMELKTKKIHYFYIAMYYIIFVYIRYTSLYYILIYISVLSRLSIQ